MLLAPSSSELSQLSLSRVFVPIYTLHQDERDNMVSRYAHVAPRVRDSSVGVAFQSFREFED